MRTNSKCWVAGCRRALSSATHCARHRVEYNIKQRLGRARDRRMQTCQRCHVHLPTKATYCASCAALRAAQPSRRAWCRRWQDKRRQRSWHSLKPHLDHVQPVLIVRWVT